MTWDDLEMVTFKRTADNRWSFTVYGPGFCMWRSNRGLEDVFVAVMQIQECLDQSAAEEEAAMKAAASEVVKPKVKRKRASGGRRSESAGEPADPAGQMPTV